MSIARIVGLALAAGVLAAGVAAPKAAAAAEAASAGTDGGDAASDAATPEEEELPTLPEHYQAIVDRRMFGNPPPGYDPTNPGRGLSKADAKAAAEAEAQQAKEEERLRSAIRFSMINCRADGTVMVGFTDSSDPKQAHSYYLKVGETRDGWYVKEADALKATMTIVKDDIEVSLTLGGDSSKNAGATARAGARHRPLLDDGRRAGQSLRERRRAKQQANEERFRREMQETLNRERAEENKRREVEDEQHRKEQQEREAQARQDEAQAQQAQQEMQQQLLTIQQQLKSVREAKERRESQEGGDGDSEGGGEE